MVPDPTGKAPNATTTCWGHALSHYHPKELKGRAVTTMSPGTTAVAWRARVLGVREERRKRE
jgi:hypothetical protein